MNLNVTTAITALTNRGRSRHTLGDSVDCQKKYMGATVSAKGRSPKWKDLMSYEVA